MKNGLTLLIRYLLNLPSFGSGCQKKFAGQMPLEKIRVEVAELGGGLIGNVYFNNHSFSITFPARSIGSSLRKARAVRRRLMKKLQLDQLPDCSITTYTLREYENFVKNISQNQTHPNYRDIMSSYIRYQTEDEFMKLYRRRARYLI